MGPGPRFEPESRDPQSRRITTYPTPALVCNIKVKCDLKHPEDDLMRGQGFEPW